MTPDEIKEKHRDSLAHIREWAQALQKRLDENGFSSSNLQHCAIQLLGQRLVEAASAAEIVATAGHAAAHGVMARTCLEAGFRLKAIALGKTGAEAYLQQEILYRHSALKRVLSDDFACQQFTAAQVAEYKRELEELGQEIQSKKLTPLSVKDWATNAGEAFIYLTAYSVLSPYVHASPESMNHIFDRSSTGQVYVQTGPSDHMLKPFAEGICHCLASSIGAIDKMFESSSDSGAGSLG